MTYDERQSAAARLAGLRTVTPSEPAVRLDAEEVIEPSEPSEAIVRSIRDRGE